MKNPNAKNQDFTVPVDLPHAKPEDYSKVISSGNGSAATVEDANQNVRKTTK